jgi:hypothetical protein
MSGLQSGRPVRLSFQPASSVFFSQQTSQQYFQPYQTLPAPWIGLGLGLDLDGTRGMGRASRWSSVRPCLAPAIRSPVLPPPHTRVSGLPFALSRGPTRVSRRHVSDAEDLRPVVKLLGKMLHGAKDKCLALHRRYHPLCVCTGDRW